jgi:UDP-N-acetylmuramyl-tripeptide synthetase
MTKLADYINTLKKEKLLVSCDIPEAQLQGEVTELTYDSRKAKKGALFVCKGLHFIPEFAVSAALAGAVAYVSEREYEAPIPAIIVTDIRLAMPHLAKLYFEDAPSKLVSVGITGTKGKSTVTYMIRSVLRKNSEKLSKPYPAILSSIENYDGVISEEAHLTTDEAIELYRHFDNAEKSGIDTLVMEVSSQALKYHRTDGITYDIGCFTNIGNDHISPAEHPDFEDYFASKRLLFKQCKKAVINLDDKNSARVLSDAKDCGCDIVTYGCCEADIHAENIMSSINGIDFDVDIYGTRYSFSIVMPGLFNVSNALAAIAVCHCLGIDIDTIKQGIAQARADGRMEVYSSSDGEIIAIVDYAHNAMSFDALFSSCAKEFPDRDIISIFGCPGKKAFQRRYDLPTIASKYSSKIYLCEEDSGEETFESISSDLLKNTSARCEVIENRGECIRSAIFSESGKRLLLITGKGREKSMKRGCVYEDCQSDVEYVLQYLDEYNKMTAKSK